MLYLFIIINGIAGLILFYILLIVVFVKRNGSFRQRNYFIDDENLNNLRNEIRGAMEKAESERLDAERRELEERIRQAEEAGDEQLENELILKLSKILRRK